VFISYEPALGPLTIANSSLDEGVPDWVICGAESGAGRRPMEQKWAEDVQRECKANGSKFWMKQMGARTSAEGAALIPAHLLIHEFPTETV
jgi:protein gp37